MWYIYRVDTGSLYSTSSKATPDLPAEYAEVEFTPASKFHTNWNPITHKMDHNGEDRYLDARQFYRRLSDPQRHQFHGSTEVERVKSALAMYQAFNRRIWLDHARFDSLFIDDLVAATDIPDFTSADKVAFKS